MTRARIALTILGATVAVLACSSRSSNVAIDGDTIDHGGERIRLLYIDAPELPGHCRPGRECVAGNAYAAKAALQYALDSGNVRCEGEARDRYGRRLAECFVTSPSGASFVSINEWMLARGYAVPYRYRGAAR